LGVVIIFGIERIRYGEYGIFSKCVPQKVIQTLAALKVEYEARKNCAICILRAVSCYELVKPVLFLDDGLLFLLLCC